MEKPAIFSNMRKNYFVDLFDEVVRLERKGIALYEVEKVCRQISIIKYVRGKDFDDLASKILFNISKGQSIDPNVRNAIYYLLKSINPMYVVDFFSVLPKLTFGRMRKIYSDEEMVAMLIGMENDGLVGIIENLDARGEIQRFMSDMFRYL